MFLLLATLIIPIFFGVAAICALELLKEKMSVLLIGAVSGWAVLATLVCLFNLAMPLNQILIASLLLVMTASAAFMAYQKNIWPYWQSLKLDKTALVVFAILLSLFSIIAPKLLIEKEDGLYTGIINAYGDVAWHMANITSFAAGENMPPENPIFAGKRLNYPFMSNFFSAILLVAGASHAQSVTLPALFLIPMLLTIFYCLIKNITNGNKLAAVAALLLFLFGGATFGWTRFGEDWQNSGQSLTEFITHLPARDYSGVGTDQNGFHFLNPVTSLLLPQRPFLFGMPLAFSILLLLLPRKNKRDAEYLAAGVLAGILPLFHAHTVVALILPILALFTLSYSKQWLIFFLTAAAVGFPQILYYMLGESRSGSFFRYGPGWMAGDTNLIWYWFKNTGLLIPISLIGLFLPAPKATKALAVSGLLLLIASNIWLFAPWAWDNFKLIIFWLLLSLPLISWTIAWMLRPKFGVYVHLIVLTVTGLHMTSASIDIFKLSLPTARSWIEWDTSAINMAEKINTVTLPGESILAAPIHNSVPALAGRPIYLGYPAHIWSHGGSPGERERSISLFYSGTISTLPDITPPYVLIGPVERNKYSDITIRENWELVAQEDGYELYKIKR